jgi:lysyl-tRNA synthetase class 2
MNILELSEQEIGRRQSLQQLREMGIDPYPAAEFPVTMLSAQTSSTTSRKERSLRSSSPDV